MKELQAKIKKHLEERGWDKLRPSDVSKSIMIEGAELLELFQWENLPLEEIKNNPEKLEKIKKELADVLIYAIEMGVLLDFDLDKVILDKLEHAAKKYPAELMRKNAKEGAGSGQDSEYWRIKEQYRKEGK